MSRPTAGKREAPICFSVVLAAPLADGLSLVAGGAVLSRDGERIADRSAVPFDPGVDELAHAGLATRPGVTVPCPSIAESPVSFECRHHVTLSIGATREIILGEVVYAHVSAAVVNERLHVDPAALDAVGRMGGHGYVRTNETFDLPTMSVADFMKSRAR